MATQIAVCVSIGLVGLFYLTSYERFVMVPYLRKYGVNALVSSAGRWNRQRDSIFSILWPAIEEAGARGLPMLAITNLTTLFWVLLLMNIGFVIGHRDRDIIGTHRWLLRYAHGLVVVIAAVWTYNLYVCFALHAIWNLSVTVRRWNCDGRDRIIVWSEGPLEILLNQEALPSRSERKLFCNMRSVYASAN